MEVASDEILDLQVIEGCVLPLDSGELEVGTSVNIDQTRSAIGVSLDIVTDPPHVALSIDCTATLNLEVMDLEKVKEVDDLSFALAVSGSLVMVISL